MSSRHIFKLISITEVLLVMPLSFQQPALGVCSYDAFQCLLLHFFPPMKGSFEISPYQLEYFIVIWRLLFCFVFTS